MITDRINRKKGGVQKQIDKLDSDILAIAERISDLQKAKKSKEQEREDLRESLIVEIVRERNISPEQLVEILKNNVKPQDLTTDGKTIPAEETVTAVGTQTVKLNNKERGNNDEEEID